MYLTHLSLTNFRAFTRLDLEIPRRILLLVGENAQGKTSLLEAVYYLATFGSFHTTNDRQLVSFLALPEPLVVARLVAEYNRSSSAHKLEVRLILDQQNLLTNGRMRKEILVDGVKRSVHAAVGQFNAVIFLPQMMSIIEDGPDERRRYLNFTLTQAVPGYSKALSNYVSVLAQRNALLKQLSERGGDTGQLAYWDTALAQNGAAMIHARIQALAALEKWAARFHQRLTRGNEILRLVYQPSYDPIAERDGQIALPLDAHPDRGGFSREEIEAGFLRRLERTRRQEIQRGLTGCGPHRDEIRFLVNGVDLGDYGSRGQARTALLALKLAEVAWLKEVSGEWPVMLLDEILAELDASRRQDLLSAVQECDQALLTTTDRQLFAQEFLSQVTTWQVQSGAVQEV